MNTKKMNGFVEYISQDGKSRQETHMLEQVKDEGIETEFGKVRPYVCKDVLSLISFIFKTTQIKN